MKFIHFEKKFGLVVEGVGKGGSSLEKIWGVVSWSICFYIC